MSWRPGQAPPTFIRISRSARPIVALARKPGPKQPEPACTPSRAATGPWTMTSGATGCVVACTPYRLNAGSSMAWTAATSTGKAAGSQRAITALTASFSSVAGRQSGGSAPSARSGGAPPSIAPTRAAVGGMIGRGGGRPRPAGQHRLRVVGEREVGCLRRTRDRSGRHGGRRVPEQARELLERLLRAPRDGLGRLPPERGLDDEPRQPPPPPRRPPPP